MTLNEFFFLMNKLEIFCNFHLPDNNLATISLMVSPRTFPLANGCRTKIFILYIEESTIEINFFEIPDSQLNTFAKPAIFSSKPDYLEICKLSGRSKS